MPKQGKKGKRPAASTKGNAKKKSKARGNVVGGSKLLAPQHNNGVAKQQLRNFLYDPVIPELDVACHRELNTMGSHAHFKPIGRKSKAVFHFEVRGFSEAHSIHLRLQTLRWWRKTLAWHHHLQGFGQLFHWRAPLRAHPAGPYWQCAKSYTSTQGAARSNPGACGR
jgi:hypothetical protein